MPKALSTAEVATFEQRGYHFPIRVLDEPTTAGFRARLEALAKAEGGKLSRGTNQKPHLLLPWLNELIRHPRIVDAIEDVLGPNLLCWATGFFWKQPNDPGVNSSHQDST